MPAKVTWEGNPAGRVVRGPRGPWYVTTAAEAASGADLPDMPRLLLPNPRETLVDRAVLVDGAGRRLLVENHHGNGDTRLDAYEAATNGLAPFAHLGPEDDLDRAYAMGAAGQVLALGVHTMAVVDPAGRPRAGYPRRFGEPGARGFWASGATHVAATAFGYVVGGGPLHAVEGYDMEGQRLFRATAMYDSRPRARNPRSNMTSELPAGAPGLAGLFVDPNERIWAVPHPAGTLAVLAPDGTVLHAAPLVVPPSRATQALRFPVGVDAQGRLWFEDAHGLAAVDPGVKLPA